MRLHRISSETLQNIQNLDIHHRIYLQHLFLTSQSWNMLSLAILGFLNCSYSSHWRGTKAISFSKKELHLLKKMFCLSINLQNDCLLYSGCIGKSRFSTCWGFIFVFVWKLVCLSLKLLCQTRCCVHVLLSLSHSSTLCFWVCYCVCNALWPILV